MPLIKIDEVDLTSPGVLAQENDVVYIPGFVDTTQANLNTDDGYIGLEAFKPTYFSNVKSFESLCGTQGVKFKTTQKYTDLIKDNGDGTFGGFSSKAIPKHRVMFYEGTVDPSYVMAKELLSAGLSVVYERINKDPDYVHVTEEPEDWDTTYNSYYENTPVYRHIADTVAPEIFVKHFKGEEVTNLNGRYYSISEDDNGNASYTLLNNDNLIELGVFTSDCYSRVKNEYGEDVTYYKFTHPADTGVTAKVDNEPVTFTNTDYCTIEVNELSFAQEKTTITANKYYTKDTNGKYSLYTSAEREANTTYYNITATVLNTQPDSWGDTDAGIYKLTKNSDKKLPNSSYTPVTFEGFTWNTENNYYTYDDDRGFTLLKEEPEIFTPSNTYIMTTFPIEVSASGDDPAHTDVPVTWYTDFVGYCEKDYEKAFITTTVDDKIPEFSANNTFIMDYFTDIKSAYDCLSDVFNPDREDGLGDMGNINIKYLTSGGYPVYEYSGGTLVNAMKAVANKRGDCIAFIDHTNNPYRTINMNLPDSIYATVKADDGITTNGEFATMFTPWMNYTRVTTDKYEDPEEDSPTMITMSATFGYLLALADSLKTNPSWLAVAGASRGQVPNLAQVATTTPITNGMADLMQPRDNVSINAITEINPYGLTIWGNRTLKDNADKGNLTATSFLNIRHLISDVKKVCYATAKALTFEQNNDVLWVNFKSKISPTLDRMVSGYGISGYKIVRDIEHEKASEKATLCAQIILYPTYAVEDFYITIVLKDEEVGVSE